MTINDKPCGQCNYFDVILRGLKPTKSGWCAKKSSYPYKEGPGQIFPKGVKRVKEGELAKPVIVSTDQVVKTCPYFQPKKSKQSKAELIKKLS